RRVVRLQAGLEQVLGLRARTAGDGAVDELDVGVLLVEHLDERVEAELLEARGPPGEDLDLAGTGLVVTPGGGGVLGLGRFLGGGGAARARSEPERCDGGERDRCRRLGASHRDNLHWFDDVALAVARSGGPSACQRNHLGVSRSVGLVVINWSGAPGLMALPLSPGLLPGCKP